MKTKEELNALKEEAKTVSKKLHELTEEEQAQVSGGETIFTNRNGEVFKIDGLYFVHVIATGEIRIFTTELDAENCL